MPPTTTTISVRVLALGGKFIGSHVGFATVDIYGADPSTPLASGLTNEGLIENTDGSGVTALIMDQPYPWGFPVRADQATKFTAEIALTEPTVLTFVATSVADPRMSASFTRWVMPNLPLTGAMEVVLVLPGLLTGLSVPAAGASIAAGTSTTITAQVRMMCGCMIDNLFWPAGNFNVQAVITGVGDPQTLTMAYSGTPSFFSVPYTFPSPGSYEISIVATEMNGNLGYTAPVSITVTQT
ncbi:MAG TPA: hypothetical protein VNO50_09700 [Pyrinomonadaceae bacterium]|nr:hypothetical protein [Pyrinomonadaceae bacterium]